MFSTNILEEVIIGLLNDQKPEIFRGVFCTFCFGGVWIPLLYLNEGHAVRCDSYPTKTAKTLFHTQPKLPNPFCQQTFSNMREGGRYSLSIVEFVDIHLMCGFYVAPKNVKDQSRGRVA